MALLIYSSKNRHKQPVEKPLRTNAVGAVADVDVLHQIANRDENAVGVLYDRHATYLFTLVKRIVKDEAEAEDTLQEVFLRVWDRAETYKESLGIPIVWMTRIARNLAIDKLRSKLGRARKAEDDLTIHNELRADESASNPEHLTSLSQYKKDVSVALAQLPKEQRVLIEFSYFQGYTQTELAVHFKVPLGTVKTRIRSGMIELRRLLVHLA